MTAPALATAHRAVTDRAAQPIGALSLGPGGWVQQLNFIVFGVLVCLSALASGCFVLATRFAAEPGWRRWDVFAGAAGLATIVFIAVFGASGGHGGLAGLGERAAGGATSVLTVAVLARLAATGRPAARARRLGAACAEGA